MKTLKCSSKLLWSTLFIMGIVLIGFGSFNNMALAANQITKFEVKIENISDTYKYISSGIFQGSKPGPVGPGGTLEFTFGAPPGSKLSFAMMYAQSNDAFFAPSDTGIALFDASGAPISGDVTSQVMLWDAGTEVNQEPGVGPDQAPRQSGPNTGASEYVPVQLISDVNDGFTYPDVMTSLRVMLVAMADNQFKVTIDVISPDPTFLISPGVWVIHTEDAPLFEVGVYDYGEGIESIAEDGNPTALGAKLATETGVNVLMSPGVWAIHTINAPIFAANQPDYGKGLESQAEDGNPAALAQSLFGNPNIISNSIFSASKPGPIASGGEFDFSFYAYPGQKLSFTTMYGQSNDLFFAPSDTGIELFDASGTPINGDMTSQVMLWDAGTEVNQQPGVGPDQAPRQSAPNTGASEQDPVQLIQDVKDGFTYDDVSKSIRVTIMATSGALPSDFGSQLSGADDKVTDTQATGMAEYHLSDDGMQLTYKVTVTNIVDATMAHIHLGPKGQAGPIVVWLYPSAPPAKQIPGTFSGVLGEGVITASNLTGQLAGMTISDLVEKILNGEAYTNVHTVKYPAGEIRGQIEPAAPSTPEDFSNVFFMYLSQGLNMISLPLKPMATYTARSFAEVLSATVVIRYDESSERFMGFALSAPDNGFNIEGGKGYIVNVPKAGTVAFTGAAWTNEPSASGAPSISDNSAWAFLVNGSLGVRDSNYAVTVRNLRTNATVTESVNPNGYFSAVYADLNRKAVIENHDSIEITVMDTTGNIVSGPYIHKVTSDEIGNAVVNIPMKLGNIKPTMSALLPNFPNPFNPETWLPYQLKDASTVSVKIYSSTGQLIRTLDLGQKDAGVYASQSKAAYWDGKNEAGEKVASGTYFYSIKAGNFSAIRKMVVNK